MANVMLFIAARYGWQSSNRMASFVASRLGVCTIIGLIFSQIAVSTSANEPSTESSQPTVTFQRDVMAVLSKASCNAGTCHGNVNGKGGFFLSLRGQDSAFDYDQLVHAAMGRRVNRIAPEKSLLLMKATAKLPHEGGKRFNEQSPEYQILTRWMTDGLAQPNISEPKVTRLEVTPADALIWMPQKELRLTVQAQFADGSRQDVTRLAVFEPSDPAVKVEVDGLVKLSQPGVVTVLVRYLDGQAPARVACRTTSPQFVWNHPPRSNFIDDAVFARLEQLKLNPAALSNDQVFLRRIYLDLVGQLPTEQAARDFIADNSIHKRERLIDELIERPEFAAMWALKWSDLIRSEEKTLDATGVERLHTWMKEKFASDVPLNQFVSELIAARGSTYKNPPANFWRAHREPFVRAETVAQVFLGVRLQCAKCHNHPFDRWSQDEYYQWSSLFAGIDYEVPENKRRDSLDSHEFVGDQTVLVKAEGEVKNARTGKPAVPKFLGSDQPIEGDRLQQLAAWLTSSDNRLFAKAQANRIWFHLMGIGLVEPVDDLRLTNPPSHPELLERLADELVANHFSVKHLVRTIVLSRTYQLDSKFDETQLGAAETYDERLYAKAVVRRRTAEQILDIQSQILGLPARFEGYPAGTLATNVAGVERVRRKLSDDDRLLRQFGKPERLLSCECERSNESTLGQALSLVGGESLNERLRQPNNRLGKLLAENNDPRYAIESMFWTSLMRSPTEQEVSAVLKLIEQTGDTRTSLEDMTWAILNAKELLFRN